MDRATANELINQVGATRRRARGDRRATSIPLLAFGAATVVDAGLRSAHPSLGLLGDFLFAPVGFVLVALYYRHREKATGVGGRPLPYVIAAVVTLVALPLLALFGGYAVAGVALVVIAVQQRNLYLAGWALVFGVGGSLEVFAIFSNRLYDVFGYFAWAPSLVYATLGLLLMGAGLYARRGESRPGAAVALA
jgi:hypothetical protein